MKTSFIMKLALGLPLVLFADWVLMTLFGCGAGYFGAGNDFYCGTYCLIGKGILLLSLVLIVLMFVPEIKQLLNLKRNAATR